MTVFDFRFNLLIAKVEWNLGNEAEKSFWTGYTLGLHHCHKDSIEIKKIETNHPSSRDETRFFEAGYSEGSKGNSTPEAAVILDRIKTQGSLQFK